MLASVENLLGRLAFNSTGGGPWPGFTTGSGIVDGGINFGGQILWVLESVVEAVADMTGS